MSQPREPQCVEARGFFFSIELTVAVETKFSSWGNHKTILPISNRCGSSIFLPSKPSRRLPVLTLNPLEKRFDGHINALLCNRSEES